MLQRLFRESAFLFVAFLIPMALNEHIWGLEIEERIQQLQLLTSNSALSLLFKERRLVPFPLGYVLSYGIGWFFKLKSSQFYASKPFRISLYGITAYSLYRSFDIERAFR